MLSGPEILRRVRVGEITIDPFDESRLNPNSYNVRIQPTLLEVKQPIMPTPGGWTEPAPLDMARECETRERRDTGDGILLTPCRLYLAATVERISAGPNLVPRIDGRSSVGRLGLFVHITAGFGDAGFDGTFTLELAVVRPLVLHTCVPLAQVSFEPLVGEPMPYRGQYQGQTGPRPSGLWREVQAARAAKGGVGGDDLRLDRS